MSAALPRWVLTVAVGLVLLPPAPAAEFEDRAPRVVRVELRSDAPLQDAGEVFSLVTVAPGDFLSASDVRRSIRNIVASGAASDVEFYTRPEGDGLVAAFVLWALVRVDHVRLEGNLGLKSAELRPAIAQKAATPLVEDRVVRSVFRLQDRYREAGYLEASVRVEVDLDEPRKRADVVFHVDSGPQATVGSVEFDGNIAPLSSVELLAKLNVGPGARYRSRAVRGDAERLREWLAREGYLQARVDRPIEEYDADSDRMALIYPIEVGPKVRIEVEGAELAALRKKNVLPILDAQGYDEALVLQSVGRLRTHYQERGHHFVRVDWREERRADELVVIFEIEPGPEYSLTALDLVGNEAFADARLAALMETTTRRLLTPGSGRLVSEVLDSDLTNLRSFYLLNGFLDVEIGPHVLTEEGEELALTVPIQEGVQRRVVGLGIDGNEAVATENLISNVPLAAGGPYHPLRLDETLDAVRARYEEAGYDRAQVWSTVDWNEARTLVDVTVHVREGFQAIVERVVLRGQQRTTAKAVRKWINLRPGEPVSTRRLLEVQRRLYSLGVFSRVQVTVAAGSQFEPERTVIVEVEEGRSRRVSYGAGYDSEDGVRGLLGYSHGNLGGRAISFQSDLRVSQRESQARILFKQPYVGRYRTPITYSLFRLEEMKESFDSERRGGQVDVSRVLGNTRYGLLYGYRVVSLKNVAEELEAIEIDRDLQEIEISSLTPSVFVDRRDDPLDPRRGWSTLVSTEYAFPFLNAKTEFVRAFAQQTGYLDLAGRATLAGSLRLGAIEPVGAGGPDDPTLPVTLPSRRIPLSERFFAGGRTSHRAYRRDRLGREGETIFDGVEVGGNGLVLANLDLRVPIAGPVGGTVFYDLGNVWADWRDADPSQLKSGVGLGVRYLSPIGPLRLEVGWKLDREPGQDPYVIFFSFGNPF